MVYKMSEFLVIGAVGMAGYAILNAVNTQNEIAARHAATKRATEGIRDKTIQGDDDEAGLYNYEYTVAPYAPPWVISSNPRNWIYAPGVVESGETASGKLRTDITSGRYTKAPSGFISQHA
jgi:hypothetical protein